MRPVVEDGMLIEAIASIPIAAKACCIARHTYWFSVEADVIIAVIDRP